MIPMQKTSNQGTRVPHRKASLRPDCDLLTRTSWADASLALAQINKNKASGNESSLVFRAWLQKRLFLLGNCIQRNPGKIFFVGVLVLSCFCVGLKSATLETDVEKLWVEEGGRLEKELRYTKKTLGEGVGSTNQIVIHSPKEEGANVLHPDAFLTHLQVLKAAVQVSVEVFDIPWSLKDMCYSPSFPLFEKHYIDMALENLFPCAIITPLDCFWEGSKLLGPDYPVKIPGLNINVQWTNLNPQWLMETVVKNFGNYVASYPLDTIESFMKRAGITTAYQEKPCLNPADEHCPSTAPNKKSLQPLDIGAALTGGCFGFAAKHMHWPEEVLVGGVTKNKTGHIVRAEALQTIIQLMAEKELHEFWRDHIKVHNLDWSVDKAKLVLEAWQRKFTEIVIKESELPSVSRRNTINVFSTTTLSDIMKDFSEINLRGIIYGCVAMLAYACVSLGKFSDPVNSQFGLAVGGVVLVSLSVAAGLGFCAILGLIFNAATTQVVPFLALGIGMDNMFLIVYQYTQCFNSENIHKEYLTGEVLKRTGVSIALTSLSNLCAFFVAGIIPIPALRTFVFQSGVLVAFGAATTMLVFPALVSLDARRRGSGYADFFCCYKYNVRSPDERQYRSLKPSHCPSVVIPIRQAVTHALPPDGRNIVTVLAPSSPSSHQEDGWPHIGTPAASYENISNLKNSKQETTPSKSKKVMSCYFSFLNPKEYKDWSLLNWFLREHLAPTLQRTPVKLVAVLSCIALVFLGVWGIHQVRDGLDLTDIVPRNTNEYRFLSRRAQYFGIFNMFAVTQGNFDYPANQRLLYEYHEAFTRVEKIIKNDNGGLPDFWLTMFRDWLLGLQKAFDDHWESGCITQEGWCNNATDDSIMAYKLLVQTGRMDNPVDKSLVKTVRLVDKYGIINTKPFYNYLSAWVSNDPLAYSASQANFVPEPRRWIHDPQDVELKMPKSQPLVYAQIPFYLNDMSSTEGITETIRAVRAVCERFEDSGLPNFPSGLPFIYWEQYLGLRYYLSLSLLCIFLVIFLVIGLILLNFWAATIVVAFLAVIIVELFGFMGIIGIKLSAVPAVILIAAVGMGVEFSAHLMMGFLTSIGTREHRMVMTLEQMFSPVLHGALSTLIGVVLLAFSEFDFIFRYFFIVLCALVVIGVYNGFVLFPVMLSVLGPPGEVVPFDDPDRIPTPSPEPSPIRARVRHARPFAGRPRIYPRVPSEISLSTITEESGSCHSAHEIIVQPEVVVETTTVTSGGGGGATTTFTTSPESPDSQSDDSKCTTPCGDNVSSSTTTTTQPSGSTAVTTRVTASAKVKVEVHAPFSSSVDISRHRHRRDSSSSRSSSARSSPT